MKATIENNDGLFLIRINSEDGILCDVYVVDEVELKTAGVGGHCVPMFDDRSIQTADAVAVTA